MLPFQDDPTADHNQQSHIPRVPLWASQNDVILKLAQLNVPTHVIFGEDDVILDAQKHGVAFSQATGARLVMIPKTGHMLPVTQPKLCNKFIEDVMSATDAH